MSRPYSRQPRLLTGEGRMAAKHAFISFDFDHDEDLRNLLAGQAKHPDTPFDMQDWSVKEPMTGDWKEKVRARIRRTDLTIVICGQYTNLAAGVAAEFLLRARRRNLISFSGGAP